MFKKHIGALKVNEDTLANLKEVRDKMQTIYENNNFLIKKIDSKNVKITEFLTENSYEVSEAIRVIDECLKYHSMIEADYELYNLDRDNRIAKTGELKNEVDRLTEINIRLEKELEQSDIRNGLKDKIDEVLDLVKTSYKSIVVSQKMQDEPITTRHDINTQDLINDYKSEMSLKAIGDKYGLTANGVKARLKNAGEYKGTYSNYKGVK